MFNQSTTIENTNSKNEQCRFCLFPKELFMNDKYKKMSNDAKVLYTLMLDRLGLSEKNDWVDKDGCIFIYFTLEEVQNTLNCGHNKGVKIMLELDEVGLTTRVKQGQGKPARIYVEKLISKPKPSDNPSPDNSDSSNPQSDSSAQNNYVQNYAYDNSVKSNNSTPPSTRVAPPNYSSQSEQNSIENSDISPIVTESVNNANTESYPQDNLCMEKGEVSKSYPQEYPQAYEQGYPQGSQDCPKDERAKCSNKSSAIPDTKLPDYPKRECNNTNISYSDINNTEIINTKHDNYPIQSNPEKSNSERETSHKYELDKDGIGERIAYESLIKNAVEYELLSKDYGANRADELVELMLDVVCSKRDYITICSDDYPKEVVKSRFLKLNYLHIQYVFGCIDKNVTKVRNIKKYLMASLYNAFTTKCAYYQTTVNYDLYGEGTAY